MCDGGWTEAPMKLAQVWVIMYSNFYMVKVITKTCPKNDGDLDNRCR